MIDVEFCSNCYMPSTRPNITFNERGVCSACQWAKEKQTIDWEDRKKKLGQICDRFRGNGKEPDMIVPFSGGKDSIYVAYKMRDSFGMTPLLITVLPHLETEIGKWNRKNTCPRFPRVEINLNDEKYRKLAKEYFFKNGKIKHPWETAISAAIINYGFNNNLPFIMYGEEGGKEYGGYQGGGDWDKPTPYQYLMNYYFLGDLDWKMPIEEEYQKMFFTQFSRFENWNPVKHGLEAELKGMRTRGIRSYGTFTMNSQISDKLQALHMYILFCKFGFGRATADAAIGRRYGDSENMDGKGWISKEQALEWIEIYDGEFPNEYLSDYLAYLSMDILEFTEVINKHRNKDITSNIDYIVHLQEWVASKRRAGSACSIISPQRFHYMGKD